MTTKVLSQSPSSIFMVKPNHFGYNPQTSFSNAFQSREHEVMKEAAIVARIEFENYANLLIDNGISVNIFEENNQQTPDAVFPNNWVSFHEDGKVVLYPMLAPNRRLERRKDIIYQLEKHFQINQLFDLSGYEQENKFLEGTGSIVFDYCNRIAYACQSQRTNEELFKMCCRELGYQPVFFQASDRSGKSIYHTNVLMAIADNVVVICMEAIDKKHQPAVTDLLSETKHEVVDISFEQMEKFAGNMIQLSNEEGRKFLAMSEAAYSSLKDDQLTLIQDFMTPLHSNLHTIETLGGGSSRCMIAGIFLPRKMQSI